MCVSASRDESKNDEFSAHVNIPPRPEAILRAPRGLGPDPSRGRPPVEQTVGASIDALSHRDIRAVPGLLSDRPPVFSQVSATNHRPEGIQNLICALRDPP